MRNEDKLIPPELMAKLRQISLETAEEGQVPEAAKTVRIVYQDDTVKAIDNQSNEIVMAKQYSTFDIPPGSKSQSMQDAYDWVYGWLKDNNYQIVQAQKGE